MSKETEKLVDTFGYHTPFDTEEARSALWLRDAATAKDTLKKLAAAGEVHWITDGLWCVPHELYPGHMSYENVEKVATKLWIEDNGEVAGYVSGPAYASAIGLQSMTPRLDYLYTNQWDSHTDLAERYCYKLVRPRTLICKQNWKYLRLLDALADTPSFDCEDVQSVIQGDISRNEIDIKTLQDLKQQLYPELAAIEIRGATNAA